MTLSLDCCLRKKIPCRQEKSLHNELVVLFTSNVPRMGNVLNMILPLIFWSEFIKKLNAYLEAHDECS